jgi:hypothetical protein
MFLEEWLNCFSEAKFNFKHSEIDDGLCNSIVNLLRTKTTPNLSLLYMLFLISIWNFVKLYMSSFLAYYHPDIKNI